ncbi:carbonic anhydrase [bacterium]|nr:MAG: carbonic anhydrase [bacterium]
MDAAKKNTKSGLLSHLNKDVPSSLVVFLVAMPLSLGIALASGAPIVAGLIAAAVGGIVVGSLGGAPLAVCGPAAGLTVLVFGMVQTLGWQTACLATLIAGLMMIGLGFSKVARLALAIPPAVVHGMLAGIGVTIVLGQSQTILGLKPESSALQNLSAITANLSNLASPVAWVGLFAIVVLIGWNRVPKALKSVPGALVAVVGATVLSFVIPFAGSRVDLPGNPLGDWKAPSLPEGAQWGAVLMAAATLAIVASIETLLSAVATDKMHDGPRANLDKDLVGLGAANALSGLLGGLPITGVIVRSSANIAAGAKTRMSTILHGVWVLVAVFLLAGMIETIPLSALAGLLIFIGAKLVNPKDIAHLREHKELPVYIVTLAGVVFKDLLFGVAAGVAFSFILALVRMSKMKVDIRERTEGGEVDATVRGAVSFLNIPKLTTNLASVPSGRTVRLHLAGSFLDHAATEALQGWAEGYQRLGGQVEIRETVKPWHTPESRQLPVHGLEVSAKSGKHDKPENPDPDHAPFDELNRQPVQVHNPGMDRIFDAVAGFNSEESREYQPLLGRLKRDGQKPAALIITCSDSRLVLPDQLSSVEPGEMYVLRNFGNLVPEQSAPGEAANDASVGATVDFAINVLGVSDIIVMGHEDCGAMKASCSHQAASPNLKAWLSHANNAVARLENGEVVDPGLPSHDQLAMLNVLTQLDHLRAYDSVRDALAAGKVRLHGWFFDIGHAHMRTYDPISGVFESIGGAGTGRPVVATGSER